MKTIIETAHTNELDRIFDLLNSFGFVPVDYDSAIMGKFRIAEIGSISSKEFLSKESFAVANYLQSLLKEKISSTVTGFGGVIEQQDVITISESICNSNGEIFFIIRIPEKTIFSLTNEQKKVFGDINEELLSAPMVWKYNFKIEDFGKLNKEFQSFYEIIEGLELSNDYSNFKVLKFEIDDVQIVEIDNEDSTEYTWKFNKSYCIRNEVSRLLKTTINFGK